LTRLHPLIFANWSLVSESLNFFAPIARPLLVVCRSESLWAQRRQAAIDQEQIQPAGCLGKRLRFTHNLKLSTVIPG
jgi:hypothetical protein